MWEGFCRKEEDGWNLLDQRGMRLVVIVQGSSGLMEARSVGIEMVGGDSPVRAVDGS